MVQASAAYGIEEDYDTPCDRHAMAQASRLILPSISGLSPLQELIAGPAEWAMCHGDVARCVESGPRLQSVRRRGLTPAYPKSKEAADVSSGTLMAFPGGLVLEPANTCRPCVNIPRSTILGATFYRDAFAISLSPREHCIVWTDSVEHIDSIFQAYFWNALV